MTMLPHSHSVEVEILAIVVDHIEIFITREVNRARQPRPAID